ncbi:MAG: S41 family peptidase [Clostridia bacterium]
MQQQILGKNAIVVLRTIGDSPASKAGLLTGDIITKVDDQEYTGEQLNEAVKKMKGVAGTTVKITVLRDSKEIEFNITRENIKISHVSSNVLDNNIGYIKISSFEGGCANEFLEKYREIEKQNIKSLIIDLRFNGGGIVDEALNIAEFMVPKGKTLLITKDKKENEDVTVAKEDAIINMPIVVLVNEYSASASEILAGILKEDIDAKLIGNTTYGKGVIQTVYTLSDGSGLKITTNEYYTPNHNKINKIGIEPTIKVELPDELKQVTNLSLEEDKQMQRAIEELK